MNTAEYLIKKLEEIGINHFFGFSGLYNKEIYDTIERNQEAEWIHCTTSKNASYAADGYARINGFGAVITDFGSAELDCVNATAGCYSEDIPIINIVGTPPSDKTSIKADKKGSLCEVNSYKYFEIYKNITCASAYLSRDNSKIEIDRVLKALIKERKPVYIAIPQDIVSADISERNTTYDYDSDEKTLNELAEKIAKKINNSKKPIIIGGSLIKRFDAIIEYKEFVSKSKIPVTNLISSNFLNDTDSENYMGIFNHNNTAVIDFVQNTDCLISIGNIENFALRNLNHNHNANNHIAIYGNYTYLEGKKYENIKIKDVLEKLSEYVNPVELQAEKVVCPNENLTPNQEPLNCKYIYSRLQEFIKDNDIIFTESGLPVSIISKINLRSNICIEYQETWQSYGWATGAVLGACSAKPSSRIILITTANSHLNSFTEIGNIIKLGFKPVIIVINENYSPDKSNNFSDTIQVNYSKFARIFEGDIWTTRATTNEDFDKALKVTQIMNKVCYIETCVEKSNTLSIMDEKIYTKDDTAQICENATEMTLCEDFLYETVVHKKYGES